MVTIKSLIAATFGVLLATAASAQQPTQDVIESNFGKQWQAYETMRLNAHDSLNAILQDRRRLMKELEDTKAYWAAYLKGLDNAEHNEPPSTPR